MPRSKFEEFNLVAKVPLAITLANMALGVMAIYLSLAASFDHLKLASLLILIAGVTDKLDGYVARKLGAASDLGKELDSLCDLVSFGVAPVLVWWQMGVGAFGGAAVLASLLYVGASAFRLARFNISQDQGHFIGLPITIAGMVMAAKYLVDLSYRAELFSNASHMVLENSVILTVLAVLMVSSLKIKKPL